MMRFRSFLLILLAVSAIGFVHHCMAQEGSRLTGHVVDRAGEPIVGATVIINALKRGAVTDIAGRFQLDRLERRDYEVQISLIGFITRQLRMTASPKPDDVRITLDEEAVEIGAVIVTADPFRRAQEDTRVSVMKIEPREAKILPGAAEDVLRSLQAMPGVLSVNDFSSQLIVRGSGPDQNLIVMDNIEVFNPYRLYGAVSMFNPETIGDISLLTGGFPAKYGDRLSAVLDVVNRDGRSQHPVYGNLNLSLTNANLVVEGRTPFEFPGSWLLSTRRTYYDLIIGPLAKNAGLVSNDVAFPNFGDIQARVSLMPLPHHKFTLTAITSRDGVDVVTGSERQSPDSVAVVNATYNTVGGLTWDWTPSDKLLHRMTVSYYNNNGITEFNGQFLDPVLDREEFRGTQSDSLKALARLFGISFDNAFVLKKWTFKDDLTWRLPGHLLEAGVSATLLEAELQFRMTISDELRKIFQSNPRGSALVDNINLGQRYELIGAFLQDRWTILPELSIQPGLRIDYYGILGRAYFSPRFSLSYAVDPVTTLRGAVGLYMQSPGYDKLFDQTQFFDLREENVRSLQPERAVHGVVGIERWISSEWQLRLDVYHKSFSDLIVQKKLPGSQWVVDPVSGGDPHLPSGWSAPRRMAADSLTSIPVNDSHGEAYGFEIMLEKRTMRHGDRLSGWVSYALAWAQRHRDGATIPFSYDQRHTINIVGSYKPIDWLEVGIFWRLGSNFPVTEPIGVTPRIVMDKGAPTIATDLSGRVILDIAWGDESRINQARKPWYHRLDLRATAYATFWNLEWAFYLDVINVYNHDNVSGYRWFIGSDGALQRRATTMFPILPTIGINARF